MNENDAILAFDELIIRLRKEKYSLETIEDWFFQALEEVQELESQE